MTTPRSQTRQEEKWNFLSHGLALLILLALLPYLYRSAVLYKGGILLWTIIPFYFGILATYGSSATYHLAGIGLRKERLRIFDHISIFFMIGGTYTPVVMQYIHPPLAGIFLGVVWSIILIGSLLKVWWTGKYNNLSTALYLFLGWMLIFIIWPLWKNTPADVFIWLILGGVFYSGGVYFYKKSQKYFYHTIWHFTVFAGTLCHWLAIYLSFSKV